MKFHVHRASRTSYTDEIEMEINTIDDLLALSKDCEEDLIISFKGVNPYSENTITIYDDYVE